MEALDVMPSIVVALAVTSAIATTVKAAFKALEA
jgi:hypothetical protein